MELVEVRPLHAKRDAARAACGSRCGTIFKGFRLELSPAALGDPLGAFGYAPGARQHANR